jgi:hypothetical protein
VRRHESYILYDALCFYTRGYRISYISTIEVCMDLQASDEVMQISTGELLTFISVSSWPRRLECIDGNGREKFPLESVIKLQHRSILSCKGNL